MTLGYARDSTMVTKQGLDISLQDEGRKYDSGKPRFSLFPSGVLSSVLEVLEIGARKYSENNWAIVPNSRTRYYDAAMRHMESWWSGERLDKETGKSHLSHAICCLMFLLWFDNNTKGTNEDSL